MLTLHEYALCAQRVYGGTTAYHASDPGAAHIEAGDVECAVYVADGHATVAFAGTNEGPAPVPDAVVESEHVSGGFGSALCFAGAGAGSRARARLWVSDLQQQKHPHMKHRANNSMG